MQVLDIPLEDIAQRLLLLKQLLPDCDVARMVELQPLLLLKCDEQYLVEVVKPRLDVLTAELPGANISGMVEEDPRLLFEELESSEPNSCCQSYLLSSAVQDVMHAVCPLCSLRCLLALVKSYMRDVDFDQPQRCHCLHDANVLPVAAAAAAGLPRFHELWPGQLLDESAYAASDPTELGLALRALSDKGPPRKY